MSHKIPSKLKKKVMKTITAIKRCADKSLMKKTIWLIFAAFVITGNKARALDIYLLAGQSNMVGVGQLEDEPDTRHPMRLFQLDHYGYFQYAHDPLLQLAPGQNPVGVGPGLWFANRMATLCPQDSFGVVQCGYGGSHMYQWMPGFNGGIALYWNLIYQAKRAARRGNIVGLLWYQGESDSDTMENVSHYAQRTTLFFQSVRRDLGIPDLPIVFVQLGPNPHQSYLPYWENIQTIQQNMSTYVPNSRMVTAKDLDATGSNDPHHLNQHSQIILGGRLAQAMYALSFQ